MQRAFRSLVVLPALLVASAATFAQAPARKPQPASKPTGQTGVLSAKSLVQRESPAIVTVFNVGASGKPEAMGSGFIVRADGVVVTNFHVVRGASDAQVKLKNGEIYDNVLMFDFDQRRDIAILKIRATNLPTVHLGDSEKLVPGDKAFAIGNPEGYDYTVSDGLISARRVIEGTEKLQITVPISHGSSGGPLYNDRGEVVGITTEGIMEGAQLINFAVPVKYLLPMLEGVPKYWTLAQVTAQTQPAPPPPAPAPAPAPEPAPAAPQAGSIGTTVGSKFTEASGHVTVTLPPGWKAEDPTNALMNLTNTKAYMLLFNGSGNADALFQDGLTRAKTVFNNVTPFSDFIKSDEAGSQLRAQTFTGALKDGGKMKVFVAGLHSSNLQLVCVAFADANSQDDLNDIVKLFSSVAWK
ncbi:MAG: trypsin-like peptidase domain-containing protein [Candidatus Acidiferrales bacterium]